MVIEGACALNSGQGGVQWSTGAMCHKHEPSADNGIASNIITSAEATSLSRHVMLLNNTTGALPVLPVTEITATCNRDYEPAKPAAVSPNRSASRKCDRRRFPLMRNRSLEPTL